MRIIGPGSHGKITNRQKNTCNKCEPKSCMHRENKIMAYRYPLLPKPFERDNDARRVIDLFGVF